MIITERYTDVKRLATIRIMVDDQRSGQKSKLAKIFILALLPIHCLVNNGELCE